MQLHDGSIFTELTYPVTKLDLYVSDRLDMSLIFNPELKRVDFHVESITIHYNRSRDEEQCLTIVLSYLFRVYVKLKQLSIKLYEACGTLKEISSYLEGFQKPIHLEKLMIEGQRTKDSTKFFSSLIEKCSSASTLKSLKYSDKNLGALQTIAGW